MEKILLILSILALLTPSAASAAMEFNLGGFIKLDMFWDSTQEGKNMTTAIARTNDQLFQHGRFQMTAQHSRFNLNIKGPNLWGAKTIAFIEMDFDSVQDPQLNAAHGFIPRLRHAMFKLNWPDTELMFGQYWDFFNEYRPENVQDTGLQFHGMNSHRVAQIRLTQKFANSWTVAGMVAKPSDPAPADANFINSLPAGSVGTSAGLEGQSSESPQVQGKLQYEADLWGKAPFEGRPQGFLAQMTAGWQRTRYRKNSAAVDLNTFGQNLFGTTSVIQGSQQYLNSWMAQANLFFPVLPTHSYNLANSASLSIQWFIGQGLGAFGFARDNDNSWFDFSGRAADGSFIYDRQLTQMYGGYVQGQYWFTNQWFVNAVWGVQRSFGIDRSTSPLLAGQQALNPAGYKYASNNDQVKVWNEFDLTLYYMPIKALKFGLQYSYGRTDWLQKLNNPAVGAAGQVQGQPAANSKDFGEAHRVEFAIFYFF